jgi:hypothetical protein
MYFLQEQKSIRIVSLDTLRSHIVTMLFALIIIRRDF